MAKLHIKPSKLLRSNSDGTVQCGPCCCTVAEPSSCKTQNQIASNELRCRRVTLDRSDLKRHKT